MIQAVSGSVRGRVQGVGFRYFVQDAAVARGLVGWVRNEGEDEVVFFAQGEKDALEGFLLRVESGPPMARVDQMVKSDSTVREGLKAFVITH